MRHEAARKIRVGPSESACRLQTTLASVVKSHGGELKKRPGKTMSLCQDFRY